MVYWSELEQEPYDPEEFVERLAWRTTGGASGGGGGQGDSGGGGGGGEKLDDGALQLHDAFVQAIKDLTCMHDAQKKKCESLEQVKSSHVIKEAGGLKKRNYWVFLSDLSRRGAGPLEADLRDD